MAGAANPNLTQAVGGARPALGGVGMAGMVPADPMQQASLAQRGALAGTVGAGTVAGTNLGQYMNPYTESVINANTADIMRGAKMGLNALGTQASQAGAFGGSRHGVAMGELGRGTAQMIGQQSAQLRQQGFQNAQQMAQQDIQNRMAQAQQLGGLGAQSFGYGQQIQQQMAQQGQAQQALQQALIDASKGQFGAYQGFPAAGLSYMTQAVGSAPHGQSTTGSQQRQLGLMDYLTAGASIYSASDSRLKTSIRKVGELANGIGIYTWQWTKEAIEAGKSNQMFRGVIAQEVRKVLPEAVIVGDDGYMRVNYSHPELRGAI